MSKTFSTQTRASASENRSATDKRVAAPHVRFEKGALTPSKRSILSCINLEKSYRKAKLEVQVLKGVDFDVCEGEFVAVVGQSGSGKSTLLHLLGALDRPDSGEIQLDGERIDNASSRVRDGIRNKKVGMIFQFYHLLPEFTTLENVLLPSMIELGAFGYWTGRRSLRDRAKSLLETMNLGHRLTHHPRELSGGEMQRTAIARSLMANPKILLADEPTGNLDSENGREIMNVLHRLHREGVTIVMVTHDLSLAEEADRIVRLAGGKVVES